MEQIKTVISLTGNENVTPEQALSLLNQIEGQIDDASTIAELEAVDYEIMSFVLSEGFRHLPPEILQRFDALMEQIESREELASNPVEEISKAELQVLATNYVERLNASKLLSNKANDLWIAGQEEEANTLWVAVRAIENFAINNYENAFKQGAIEADWRTAVDLADAELSQSYIKDVTALSIDVLNSHKSSEVLVGKKLITFNHEEKILNVTDRQTGYFLQTTLSEEGEWDEPNSCFHTAELGSFKQQLSEHLSDRALSNDLSERQKKHQPERQNKSTQDLELD